MGNESAANLIDRILADAKEAADRILADAEASISGIRESRDTEIAKKAEQVDKERQQQIGVILNGCRTRAELDGRKETLRAKRTLLDGVFTEAEYAEVKKQCDELIARFRATEVRQPTVEEYKAKTIDVIEVLRSDAPNALKNRALRSVIDRIVFRKPDIDIFFSSAISFDD